MSIMFRNQPPQQVNVPNLPETAATPAYTADELTDGGKLAFICHRDQVYTLRITRADKLILTK